MKFTEPGGDDHAGDAAGCGNWISDHRRRHRDRHGGGAMSRSALAPFGQVDSRLARRYEGTGLGLPLAKALVELHGGVLSIESAPGKGTVVTVVLQLAAGSGALAAPLCAPRANAPAPPRPSPASQGRELLTLSPPLRSGGGLGGGVPCPRTRAWPRFISMPAAGSTARRRGARTTPGSRRWPSIARAASSRCGAGTIWW